MNQIAPISTDAPLPSFLDLNPAQYSLSKPLTDDILLLDHLLGSVLREQEGEQLLVLARRLVRFAAEESFGSLFEFIPELQDPTCVRPLLRAFTVLFQLLNTAEQKEIVRVNRERQARAGDLPRPESIGDTLLRLRSAGMTAEQTQELLNRIDICPTLTAHPTEARRRAVLDKLQRIATGLSEYAQRFDTPRLDRPLSEEEGSDAEIYRALTELWQTDELRASPITVPEEARNALYFFESTIFDVVPHLHADLRATLEVAYPGHHFHLPPFLTYRSWVGGDRDGNPNVTPDVTWRTLLEHRRVILTFYRDKVDLLRRELTLAQRHVDSEDTLLASIESDREIVPLAEERQRRYVAEPYALKLLFMHERLQANLRHLQTLIAESGISSALAATGEVHAYPNANAFLEDLLVLQNSLRANRAGVLADSGAVAALVVQVRTFGFHLAALDIRQHSDEHARALTEIFESVLVLSSASPYKDLSENDKIELLTRELLNPRPLVGNNTELSPETKKVLDVFRTIRRARQVLSADSVTAYIVSMTHEVSDLLEVLLLAKEMGMGSDLDIVPLFETIDDLRNSGNLMQHLFDEPTYRNYLRARGDFQEIMLGYSDSSKDGGFLAANWSLHDTQGQLARVCRAAGIALRFFHGRGGTVGRGGGRANRAILSQPPGSFDGRIRFTEQGEVISFRYSLLPIAHRHLEQIVSAVLLAAAPEPIRQAMGQNAENPEWIRAMSQMAADSRAVYRALVHTDPDFWLFYAEATPIKHISRLPIASRPVSRSGKKLSSVDDLRAIPWVFAWIQSRYGLPGWYGLGSALAEIGNEKPENLLLLQQMYTDWLFFRTVIDNAQLELVRADIETAAHYAARTQPAELGERFHAIIASEHHRTVEWVLKLTQQEMLLGHAPVVRRTVELRNPAVLPLSLLQVTLMEACEKDEERWRDAMLLSITGIAAAMQSTG